MNKTALITGVTGQDGSYLAELLIEKGYKVYGIVRRVSTFNRNRIEHLHLPPYELNKELTLFYGDLSDSSSLNKIIRDVRPDEIYNLAAQSHVKVSFDIPEYTGDIGGLGVTRLLEAVRESHPAVRFYQASSSEMFGAAKERPQKETTPFYPRSPYACAKVYAFNITRNYREAYGIYAVNGILFNHESPRRGQSFITRKISRSVGRIKYGLQDHLTLGNLDAIRDWGYAPEYVEAMWRMLQAEKPEDFAIATGEMHSVREFCSECFSAAGFTLEWKGRGLEEKGISSETGKTLVRVSERYFRPTEVDFLQGDPSKARKKLGWQPKVMFKELAKIMVKADMDLADREAWEKKRNQKP